MSKNKDDVLGDLGVKNMMDAGEQGGMSILLHGPAGHGKTRFCGTAPGVLHLDCDLQGSDSLRNKDVASRSCTKLTDLKEVLDAYHAGRLPTPEGIGRTVAIDPLTEVHLWFRNFYTEASDHDITALDDWNRVQSAISNLVRQFRDLTAMGVNVIFTTTVISEKDELEGRIIYSPDLYGAMSRTIGRLVSVVLYAAAKKGPDGETVYALRTQANEKYSNCKFRVPEGIKVPLMIAPDFRAVHDIWSGEDPSKWDVTVTPTEET